MKHFLVIFLVTCYLSNNVKSDSSSSEEDSAESSEELFGIENINIKSEDQLECIDFIKIEEVESCFAAKCKAECVAINGKIAGASQLAPESCSWGCMNQISTFKASQDAFRKTSAELLLGTSVDRCWDGCIERSSELDQTSCISGCETMRKIQKKQLTSKKQVEQTEVKPVETNELFQEKHDEPQESKNNARADKEGIQEEPAHVVRTYILLHPMDQQHAFQAYNMMFNIVQKMFQKMDDMNNSDDDKQVGAGWKDDRRQLRIPQYQPRVAALTSPGDQASEVYNKVVDSLDNLKGKIQEAVSRPEFKENVFYCLMAICCFLLLTALYDSCTEDQAPETEEDHFLLPNKAATVKLPTYEDCIKADKYVSGDAKDTKAAKDVEDVGNMTKADLSLSFSVVLDDENSLHK
eukprot:TRINITY_DN16132_c0_g1_i3.p1 TRINITY_DN16132_c0_g1~~TRINITY_DN16132_c0_g1_i3.p1  ORF type:complete len:408 (+),score=111.96 TRINITY_DN16132_c0_g1_i3:137-1360(+)